MSLVESLIKKIYHRFANQVPELAVQDNLNQQKIFPKMTYQEALSRHGSDKPDLRIAGQVSRHL